MIDIKEIFQSDPLVAEAILHELNRQRDHIELIASENFTSPAVMAAMGTHLTNKYAEGYPGKRYYGGCEFVDVVETLAIERAKTLFGAEHANVQPHSGAQANTAVYIGVLNPGDTILGMNLAHGGHLTHGSPVNISGKLYNIVPYGVREDNQQIDYDQVRILAHQHKPKLIVAGASAYSRAIDFKIFRDIANEVNALLMVDMAHIAGLVASGLHQNPVSYADFVTSTTHKTLRGPRGGLILCKSQYANVIDKAIFPGIQGGPLMHVIAAKAICFHEALKPEFKVYQQMIIDNAQVLSSSLIENGFNLVSGGTDNHLMLINLLNQNITGKEAEKKLDMANITVNKNAIPFDPQSPFVTSGIRLGTPAITSRGMTGEDMKQIAKFIRSALRGDDDEIKNIKYKVQELCMKYPLYDHKVIS